MPAREYTTKAKVYLWSAQKGSWHFVKLTKKLSKEIKFMHGELTGGWGSIPVKVSIGETSWKTSVFWGKEGYFVLPLKKAVRKAEGIEAGNTISFTLEIAM